MPNYTPISLLPYPLNSERPNGPDQFQQLAREIEPKLVNFYRSASERASRIPAPREGMLTYRGDIDALEMYNGSRWVGAQSGLVSSQRVAAHVTTDRNFSTTPSGPLNSCRLTLKNTSPIYKMLWFVHSDFEIYYKWTARGINAVVRHYVQIDASKVRRDWNTYTSDGASTHYSGAWPLRTGTLQPNASTTITTWFTIEKAASPAGTVTYLDGSTSLAIFGVSSA